MHVLSLVTIKCVPITCNAPVSCVRLLRRSHQCHPSYAYTAHTPQQHATMSGCVSRLADMSLTPPAQSRTDRFTPCSLAGSLAGS
eukprot:352648-Chlamydomonas_euryale.AAC.1